MSSYFSRRALVMLGFAFAVAHHPGPPASAAERQGPYAPYENLIEVLADFSRHLRDDLYRFPAPKDIVGRNLFAVTLERLENFRMLHPDEMADVIGFASAEALVRLGRYAAAARAFERVAALDSPLAKTAEAHRTEVTEIERVHALPEDGPDLETTLARMRAKLAAWDRLIMQTKGTPYEGICRREEEHAERRVLTTIIDNRTWLADGIETAVQSAAFLVTKHVDSRTAPTHVIQLADLYANLARDYVVAHPEANFDEHVFSQQIARALEVYARISALDGIPEKPEAQAKLGALQAYHDKVLSARR
jgi:hypothetical protein